MNTLKQCKQCHKPKTPREFYKMKGMLDGYQKICIECYKKKVKDKYWAEKELGSLIRL